MTFSKSKMIGVLLLATDIILLLLLKFKQFHLFSGVNSLQAEGIYRFIMLMALVIIGVGDKTKNGKMTQIKSQAFQLSFLITLCVLIAQGTSVILPDLKLFNGIDFFMTATISMVTYLVTCYLGNKFNFFWESYLDNGQTIYNSRENSMNPGHYLTVGLISLPIAIFLVII